MPSHTVTARERRRRYPVRVGLALILCLALVALFLLGWRAPTTSAPAASGDLVILSGRDDSRIDDAGIGRRQALIDLWNRVHPEWRARIVELSGDADQQRTEMVTRAQDPASTVDVYNLDVTLTAEFAENDYIVPLTGVSTEGFLRRPLDTCLYERRFDGVPGSGEQLWALPFNTDAGLLYYRADQVRPPESWDSVVNETDRVFASPDHDRYLEAGYTTQLKNYEGLTVNVLEVLRDLDVPVEVDDGGHLAFDGEDLTRVVQRFRNGLGPIVLRASLGYDERRSTQAMRDGKTLYLRNWPLAYRALDTRSGESSEADRRRYEIAQLPGGGVLGGQNLAVARRSPRREAALLLIKFLTNPVSQKTLFTDGGFAATRGSVYDDLDVRALFPYAGDLRTAVENAAPRPEGPCYARFSKLLRDAVNASVRGDGGLDAALVARLDAALNCRPASPG